MESFPLPYHLYHLIWAALDLLLPPTCAGCGIHGSRWCPSCRQSVLLLEEPLCHVCGMPPGTKGELCRQCAVSPPAFTALRSWTIFGGAIQRALHQLKYRRDVGLAESLTPDLADFVSSLHWCVDLVVPVPLGRKRLRERGYNQASLVARPLAMALGIAFVPEALVRSRETRSQVGLTRAERRLNVGGAFQGRAGRVGDRRILLVDDVATTGSTLSSCAEALRAAGARDVFALTVARALGRSSLNGA